MPTGFGGAEGVSEFIGKDDFYGIHGNGEAALFREIFWVSDFFGVLECTNIGQTEL